MEKSPWGTLVVVVVVVVAPQGHPIPQDTFAVSHVNSQ